LHPMMTPPELSSESAPWRGRAGEPGSVGQWAHTG
jgi:hypothetical protein